MVFLKMPAGLMDGTWRARASERWSLLREFLYGLRVAWVSTASVIIGILLYIKTTQTQDLFLEAKGDALLDLAFWGGFYAALILAWALPVFVSARWILTRFEEGGSEHPNVPPVATWVRRRAPLALGAVCFLAVFAGQLTALYNAPTVQDTQREESVERAGITTRGACIDATGVRYSLCRAYYVPQIFASAVSTEMTKSLGRGNMALIGYLIGAVLLAWFWPLRPKAIAASSRPRLRRGMLALAGFAFCASALLLLFAILLELLKSRLADERAQTDGASLYLLGVGVVLVIVIWLAHGGRDRGQWWLGTVSAVPVSLSSLIVFFGFANTEFQSTFGLPHLFLLPAMTAAVGGLMWWLLSPRSDGSASHLGHALMSFAGSRGKVNEDTATVRLINPLFYFLLLFTLALILLLVTVHPLHVTGSLHLHRAVLLPIILGLPVAMLTYLTHWSSRVRAPLIFAAVLVIGIAGFIWGDSHNVRTVENTPARLSLAEAAKAWARANDCEPGFAPLQAKPCPTPIIVAAAGGASRSAFHVAGVIGTLLDEQRFSPIRGHTELVVAASFSPDGKRILSASYDRTARIWDAATGRLLLTFEAHAQLIEDARFNHDGTRIVTASRDTTARIWDAATGAPFGKPLEGHAKAVTSAAFSPDGRRIATGSLDNTIRIWDAETGTLLGKPLEGHTNGVLGVAWSPDGKVLASGSHDDTARLWDAVTGTPLGEPLKGHSNSVQSVTFSHNGTRLVTASIDNSARIWDVASRSPLVILDGHYGRVSGAAFSPDDTKVVTASWDNTVRVWGVHSGLNELIIKGHSNDVNSAAFSPDGTRIVTASDDKTVRIWDAKTGRRHSWTIDQRTPFGNQLFAISAVSGGALGAAVTYGALADARRDNPSANSSRGIGRPPCTTDAARYGDWFAAPIREVPVQEIDPTGSWRDCLQLLVSGDFLSPVFVSMFSNDPLRLELRGNRATVLEHAWEARYARLTGQKDGVGLIRKEDGDSTMAQPLTVIRKRATEAGIWLPILLLNGTSVETGRRIITSDIDTLRHNTRGEFIGLPFRDSYDLHMLLQHESAAESPKPKCPGCDIRLSTAVTMSARFPLISPPGTILGRDGKVIDRVVDGGYYENFGANTAMELALALPALGLPKPIIILLNNSPKSSDIECVTGYLAAPRPASAPWFPTFSSPLHALFATRNARGTHAAGNLCELDKERFAFITVTPDPRDYEKDLSMSWWMSKHVQKYLDEQIDHPVNVQALNTISARRGRN